MITMTPIDCAWCGAHLLRALGEVNRASRSGRNIYCNLACSGLAHRAKKSRFSEERRAAERARWDARKSNPEEARKRKARTQTQTAIFYGTLIRQPCEVCGASTVDAHHDDYSKPLEVRWLCRPHHHQHHAAMAAKEAA